MGRKIFVTYKYSDSSVRTLDGKKNTTVRDYVNRLHNKIDHQDHIYKGEEDDEPLDEFRKDTIRTKLKDRIFDSSITIILMSKNMRDKNKEEFDQWIPWEISYSLRKIIRKEQNTSLANALLAVLLPDEKGNYGYFMRQNSDSGAVTYYTKDTFQIISRNMFNRKKADQNSCKGKTIYDPSYFCSYIHLVRWDEFIEDLNKHIDIALRIRDQAEDFQLVKNVRS